MPTTPQVSWPCTGVPWPTSHTALAIENRPPGSTCSGTTKVVRGRGVVATNGEHGELPEDLRDGETLVERRRAETEASAAALGIDRVVLLGYRDSGMTGWEQNADPSSFLQADVEEAASRWSVQFGLTVADRNPDRALLRCGYEPYCLELVAGEPGHDHTGFELRRSVSLDQAADHLAAVGVEFQREPDLIWLAVTCAT